MISYHNKTFRAVSNSDNGETSNATVFHYRQEGNIVTADYAGGAIRQGLLIGLVSDDGQIEMRYQHVNDRDELMTGVCHSTPEVLPNGKLRLHENWRWTSGDQSAGSSIIEEL